MLKINRVLTKVPTSQFSPPNRHSSPELKVLENYQQRGMSSKRNKEY